MKKKIIAMTLITLLVVCMTACGSSSSTSTEKSKPLDLTGTWKQTNSGSDDSWQQAKIKDKIITIYWISDNGDTKSLYWKGSYKAPAKSTDTYSWTSKGDTDAMDSALLASTDKTKKISYSNGVLSYKASALGTTTTVKLEKK